LPDSPLKGQLLTTVRPPGTGAAEKAKPIGIRSSSQKRNLGGTARVKESQAGDDRGTKSITPDDFGDRVEKRQKRPGREKKRS